MKMAKKLFMTLIATTICMGSVVGCSSEEVKEEGSTNKETSQSTPSKETPKEEDGLKEAELTWYFRAEPMVDQEKVFDAANGIIKEEINTTVNFVPIAPAEYNQKMQTKYASGDAGDITWTAAWANNYAQNVGKGAFIPLDDLLNEYAPGIKGSVSDKEWQALKIDGQIYGIPNVQIFTNTNQIHIRKDYADKYGFTATDIEKLEEIEPFLADLRAGETKDVVYEWNYKGRFGNLQYYYGLDPLITELAYIRVNDESLEVVNVYETPEFREYLELTKRWADAGYIANDAMTKKDQEAEKKAGKIIGDIRGNYKPGEEIEVNKQWGTEMITMPISEPVLTTNGITATINAIPTTSKNPERAMMFLELVNTNSELYNLLSFGIEGEHYEALDGNFIKPTASQSKYTMPNWVIGNVTNGYLLEGKQQDEWEKTLEMNANAKASPALGFTVNLEPVKTQLAQVQTIIDEYLPGLGCGTVDIDKVLPEFQEKLKSAGVDEIIAETQKQVHEWAAKNK